MAAGTRLTPPPPGSVRGDRARGKPNPFPDYTGLKFATSTANPQLAGRPLPAPAPRSAKLGPVPDRRGAARAAVASARRGGPIEMGEGVTGHTAFAVWGAERRGGVRNRRAIFKLLGRTGLPPIAVARAARGVWELFVCRASRRAPGTSSPSAGPNGAWRGGKADPMAALPRRLPRGTASVVYQSGYTWGATPTGWRSAPRGSPLSSPMSVYEVHLGVVAARAVPNRDPRPPTTRRVT